MPSLLASLTGGGTVVPFEKVRVVLRRSDGTTAKDTLVDFPSTADSVALSLLVPLPIDTPEEGLPLSLTMAYVNAVGDTVFRGGPSALIAAPVGSPGANAPVVIPVRYDGVGANAARVAVTPDTGTRIAGTTSVFTGTAFDAQNQPVANTPLVWYTLDSARAVVANAAVGSVAWQPVRGVARIVAALPGGDRADTAFVTVTLPASKLVVESGNAQSGTVSAALPQPIVLRTLASDDVPVAGVIVTFAVATGGGSLTALADTSDANGFVTTSWTLGAPVGVQSITATAAGLTGSPMTITATANPGVPTTVVLTQVPTAATAGAPLTPPVLAAVHDAAGNVVTSFTGTVSLELPAGANGGVTGTTSVNAVAGVATFADVRFPLVGAYNLIAVSAGLAPDTSVGITVTPAAAAVLAFVDQPIGSIAGLPFAPPVTVVVRDAFGNVATGFTGAVTVGLLNAGGATLSGTVTVNAAAGVATFSSLAVDKVGAAYALEAISGALTRDTSAVFGISPALPSAMVVVSGDAQTGTAGLALAQPIVVEVRDAFGNAVPGVTVSFAAILGGGSAAPPSGTSDALGRVGTTWTLGPSVGAQTLRATAPVAPAATADIGASASAGVVTQLVVTQGPAASYTAGVAFVPALVVAAQDAFGNPVVTFADNVTMELVATPGGALLGTTTVAAVSGIATFDALQITAAGTPYSLRARFGAIVSATSSTFGVTAAAPVALDKTAGDAQTGTVGSALPTPLTVRLTDAFGNGVAGVNVNWSVISGRAALLDTVTLTDGTGLTATTAVIDTVAGPIQIGAFAAGLAGSPVTFAITAVPTTPVVVEIAGGNFQTVPAGALYETPISVRVSDQYGNVVPGVSVSFVPGTGASAFTDTVVVTDAAGVASTTPTAATAAGTAIVEASAAGVGNVQFNVTITPAAIAVLVYQSGGIIGTAGELLPAFQFQARDQYGNWLDSYDGNATVTVDSGPPGATITGTTTVAAVSGQIVFSDLALPIAGDYRLRITSGAAFGLTPDFTNFPNAVALMSVVGSTSRTLAPQEEVTDTLKVLVTDAFGNPVPGQPVTWTVLGSGVTLAAGASNTDASGVAAMVFTAGDAAGLLGVRAEIVGVTGSPVDFAVTVTTAPSSRLFVAAEPGTATAGATMPSIAVAVRDAFGNVTPGYAQSITVAVDSGPSVTLGGTTSVTPVAGIATFATLSLNTAGTYRLRFSGSGLADTLSALFTVQAAAPSVMALVDGNAQTDTVSATLLIPLRVRVDDAFGNPVAGVTVNWVPVGAGSVASPSSLTDAGGIAAIEATLGTAVGATSFEASVDGLGGSPVSFSATATSGAAVALVIVSGDGQTAQAGAAYAQPLVVRAEDSHGNPVAGVQIVFDLQSGASALSDTSVATDAAGEVSVTATAALLGGPVSIVATSPGIPQAQFTMTITAAAPATLAYTLATSNATAGEVVAPLGFEARDAFGNVAASYTGNVTIAISGGPAGATIGGTLTRAAVAGVVTFDDLTFSVVGDYVLSVTDGTIAGIATTFSIFAAAAANLAVEGLTTRSLPVLGELSDSLRVKVTDAFGNPVSSVTVNWSVLSGSATLSASSTQTDADGLTAISLTGGALVETVTIEAASGTLAGSPVTFSVDLQPGAAVSLLMDTEPVAQTAGVTLAPFAVSARDGGGNLVTAFTGDVVLALESGPVGATIGGTTTVAAVSGVATFSDVVLETAGDYVLRLQSAGLADVLTTSITVAPAAASEIRLISGDAQSDTVALTLADRMRVRVLDAFGNPVSGVTVNWAAIGSGTPSAPTTSTDATGFAEITYTLGTTAGADGATATVSGLTGSPVSFPATAIPSSPTALVLTAEPTAATAGAVIAPWTLEARDVHGNVVTWFGDNVTATVASGSGTLSGSTVRNAVAGIVSFDNLFLTSADAYVIEFTAGALAVSSNLSIAAAAAASLAVWAGNNQSGFVTQGLDAPLVAAVRDAFGNPIVGDTVVFVVTVGGGTLSSTSATDSVVTNAAGFAVTTWILGTDTLVTHAVEASRTGLPTIAFSATPLPFVANRVWTGQVDSDITNAGNWRDGVVPVPTDSVLIPAARPNYPVLASQFESARLTVNAGASIATVNHNIRVTGQLDNLGTIAISGTGLVQMAPAVSARLLGNLPNLQVLTGTVLPRAGHAITGNVHVTGSAVLDLEPSASVSVGGNLLVDVTARLVMQGTESIIVAGDATLSSETLGTGLDGGTLSVTGNFSGSSSLRAAAAFTLALDSPGIQTITLSGADASFTDTCSGACLGAISSTKPSGGLIFASDVKAIGGIQISGDTLGAEGFTVIGVGGTSLQSAVTTARRVAYNTFLNPGTTFAVDSLIAFGSAGQPLVAAGSIPTRVVGSHSIDILHAGNVIVEGTLDVNGTAEISGSFTTVGAGKLRMTDSFDSLRVASARFEGLTDDSQLTAGVLDVVGAFEQVGGPTTFAAQSGSHVLRMSGATPSLQLADAAQNPIGTLRISDGATADLGSQSVQILGDIVIEGTTATALNGGLEVLVFGSLIDAVGGRWGVATTRFQGASPALPGAIPGNVVFASGVALNDSLNVGGTVRVTTTSGLLTLNAHTLRTTGFTTDDGGRLDMSTVNDSLDVLGNIAFEGGASVLTAGVIRTTGSISQSVTADAVRAAPAHETVLAGAASSLLNFANPGTNAGLSHLGALTLAKSPSSIIDVLSPVALSGVLTAPSEGNYTLNGSNVALTSGGAAVQDLTFNGVRWAITAGENVTNPITDVAFTNQDVTAVQLAISRSGGAITLANANFAVTPTSGVYIALTDEAATDNDTLTLTMVNPTPAFSGGRFQLVGGAQLLDWDAFVAINWTNTGGDQLWTNPTNWAEGVVPSATDSVVVTGSQPPIIAGPTQVRALNSATGLAIQLNDTLTVTRSVWVPFESVGISCGVAGALKLVPAGDSVTVRGDVNCGVAVPAGVAALTGVFLADSVLVSGTAAVHVNGFTLNTAGALRTINSGALRMDQATSTVEINGPASFGGATPAGALSDGTLIIRGDFEQVGPATAFQASGAHLTRFAGGQDQLLTFSNPDGSASGSHFHDLELAQEEGGVVLFVDSDVFANGRLIATTGASRALESQSTARTLRTNGAEVTTLTTFQNVQWFIGDGAALSPSLTAVRFIGMPDNAVQLAIARAGGSFSLTTFEFDSTAANSTYLQLDDQSIGDGALTVTMLSPLPAFHANRVALLGEAVLANWNAAPVFVWTGAISSSWNLAGNWSDNVVPNAASSVTIPDGATNQPATIGVTRVRELLVTGSTVTFDINDSLFIADALTIQSGAAVTCVGSGHLTLVPTSTAALSGSIGCPVRMPQGSVDAVGAILFQQPVLVDSVGTFRVGANTVTFAEGASFVTADDGVFSMEHPSGNVTANAQLSFGGGSTTGRLTAGTLTVRHGFEQTTLGATTAFDADAGHNTVIFNDALQAISFAHPGSSGFGTLVYSDGSSILLDTIAVRGSLTVTSGSDIAGANSTIAVGGAFIGDASLVDVRMLRLGGAWQATGTVAADSVLFTGTNVEIPTQFAATPITWPSIAVTGTVRFTSDGTPTDTLRINGSLLVRGAGGEASFDVGDNAGDSLTVRVSGYIGTQDNGVIRMIEPGAKVRSTSGSFLGGPTNGLLTAGEISFTSSFGATVANAYSATAAHNTRIGLCSICDGIPINVLSGLARFGRLALENSSTATVSGSLEADTLVMSGSPVGFATTGAVLRVNKVIGSTPTPTLTVTTLSLGEGLAFDGGWAIDTLLMTGTGHTLPAKDNSGDEVPYQNVVIEGDIATIMANGDSLSVSGAVVVRGSGRLRFNDSIGSDIVRVGSLRTEASGIILMLDASTTVRVFGAAVFAGGSTEGWLDAGTIEYHGDFTQLATTSAESYRANLGHNSNFPLNEGVQVVSFASPGVAAGASRFGHFNPFSGTSNLLRLATDVAMHGQFLQTVDAPIEIESTDLTPHAIVASGASVRDVVLRRVRLEIVDAAASVFTFLRDLSFVDQDPASVQLSITRGGGDGLLRLVNPVFATTPTSGAYLRVEDTPSDAGTLTLLVENPSPGGHGGLVQIAGGAVLDGWNETGVFVFTGAVDADPSNASNWTPGLPALTDSVVVDNSVGNDFVLVNATQYRALTAASGAKIVLQNELTVRSSLDLSGASLLTCDPGHKLTHLGGASIDGRMLINNSGCDVEQAAGSLLLNGASTVRNLTILGGAFEALGTALTVANDFSTTGGFLRSTLASNLVTVQGNASFNGPNGSGTLTAGRLVVYGNLAVAGNGNELVTAAPFHVALGNPDNSGGVRTVSFGGSNPGRIDSLTIHEGTTTVLDTLPVARWLDLDGASSTQLLGGLVQVGFGGTVGQFITEPNSSVTPNRVELFGTMPSSGNFSPDTVDFWGTTLGDGVQSIRAADLSDVAFNYNTIRIFGNAAMRQVPTGIPFAYQIANNVEVVGGQLLIGDQITQDTVTVNISGDLLVQGALAGLGMSYPSVVTADSAHFQGGFTSQLASGRLVVRSLAAPDQGIQTNTLTASGTHVLDLYGSGAVWFSNYAFNPLNVVRVDGGAVVSIRSYVKINGSLGRIADDDGVITLRAGTIPGFAQYIFTNGTAFGASNSGLLLRDVALALEGAFPGSPGFTLNNVTFAEMDPDATFLSANWTGVHTPTWNNITFDSPVSASGRYFNFLAGDGGSAITFTNATPAVGCLASICLPTEFEPSPEPTAQWVGGTSTAWTDPSNWDGTTVPTAGTDVTVPSGTTFSPFVSANTGVRSLLVAAGATLAIDAGDTLSVYGSVDVDGTVSAGSLQSAIRMVPQVDVITLSATGAIDTRLTIGTSGGFNGTVRLGSRVNLTAANFNTGLYLRNGLLDLNGNTLSVAGSLRTFGQSRWQMTNALDTLIVLENFEINGGDTEGLLTNGEIVNSGVYFRQEATNSSKSFAATGSHSTRLAGGALGMDLWFDTPDSTLSRFANLAIDRTMDQYVYMDYSPIFATNLTRIRGLIELFSDGDLIVTGSVAAPDAGQHEFTMYEGTSALLLGVNQTTCDGLAINVTGSLGNFLPIACHSDTYAWAPETGTQLVNNHAAWAATDTDIWVVGDNGTIQRGTGSGWTTETSNTANTLYGIHGISATDVWAVGANGTVVKWNGAAWGVEATPTTETLRGVYAYSATNVYAVGDNGTILHYDGASWTAQTSSTGEHLYAIYDRNTAADQLIAVGANDAVLRLVSGSWTATQSGAGVTLRGSYANTNAGFFAVGAGGNVRQRYNFFGGPTWFVNTAPTLEHLNAIAGTSTLAFAVGANGTILRLLGESLVLETSLISNEMNGVAVTPNGTVYVAGANGLIHKGTIVP